MIIGLLTLMLLNPWQGVWRIVTPQQPGKSVHLSVSEQGQIQLYDSEWAPYEIIRSDFQEKRFFVEAVEEDGLRPFTVEGEMNHDRLAGTIRLQMPQWLYEAEFSAVRVHTVPFPSPPEWVSRHREEDRIDILGFIREKAPLGSLDQFLTFWEETVEPEFYIFLNRLFYGQDNDLQRKAALLEELYRSLSTAARATESSAAADLQPDRVIEPGAVSPSRDLGPVGETSSPEPVQGRAAVSVRIPLLSGFQTEFLKLATIRNDYGPGVKFCCGRKPYSQETFQLVPVQLQEPESAGKLEQ